MQKDPKGANSVFHDDMLEYSENLEPELHPGKKFLCQVWGEIIKLLLLKHTTTYIKYEKYTKATHCMATVLMIHSYFNWTLPSLDSSYVFNL